MIWEFELQDRKDIRQILAKHGKISEADVNNFEGVEESDSDEEGEEDGEFKVPKAKKAKGVSWTKKTKLGQECQNFRLKGGRWKLQSKHYFMQNSNVKSVQLHKASSLLVAGFDNGTFGLYDLSFGFQILHKLSISSTRITSVAINNTGEWLAFATSLHGQLLVWEWQSEKCSIPFWSNLLFFFLGGLI